MIRIMTIGGIVLFVLLYIVPLARYAIDNIEKWFCVVPTNVTMLREWYHALNVIIGTPVALVGIGLGVFYFYRKNKLDSEKQVRELRHKALTAAIDAVYATHTIVTDIFNARYNSAKEYEDFFLKLRLEKFRLHGKIASKNLFETKQADEYSQGIIKFYSCVDNLEHKINTAFTTQRLASPIPNIRETNGELYHTYSIILTGSSMALTRLLEQEYAACRL